MSFQIFLRLEEFVNEHAIHYICRDLDIREKLIIFLVVVVHKINNRQLQKRFQHSKKIIHWIFHEIFTILLRLHRQYIEFFIVFFISIRIKKNSRFSSYFDDCLKALNEIHIDVHVSIVNCILFRDKIEHLNQNVLVVCTFDMRFVYVFVEWKNFVHDNRVLSNVIHEKKFVISKKNII